jgi:hypothetical protein
MKTTCKISSCCPIALWCDGEQDLCQPGWMGVKGDESRRIDRLEFEVKSLKEEMEELRASIRLLQNNRGSGLHPVEVLLRQSGLPVLSAGVDNLMLPLSSTPSHLRDAFYDLMRRYSFRLFLRDLIQFPEGLDLTSLTRYCSRKTVQNYLKRLMPMGIVAMDSGTSYRFLPRHIVSFGPTLEWYVGEVFQREFLAPSLFNLRLEHTRFGGDYDVVTLMTGRVIYVEVKSSPPRGIEQRSVDAFLNRLRDLQPHIAIFLVDTELRMLDKLVPMFDEALKAHRGDNEPWTIERVVDEIFQIGHTVFITNSRKGIYSNMRVCVRHAFHHQKWAGMPVHPSENGDRVSS